MTGEYCAYCRHFTPVTKLAGKCVRYPPVVVVTGKLDIDTAWPKVSRGDRCGEWKQGGEPNEEAETGE